MKRAINIVLILWFSASFAQNKEEIFSVYFHENAFKEMIPTKNVASSYFGRYELIDSEKNQMRNAAGEYLVVDETGVYLEKNKILFITREEVRENSKYEIRNGYLFGVIENDSVLTALEGENYYFLIPAKTYLYQFKVGSAVIYDGLNKGEYLVASPEPNDHYSCIYFKFRPGRADITELTFMGEGCTVEAIQEKETLKGDFDTFILSPTLVEWRVLFACFSIYDEYVIAK